MDPAAPVARDGGLKVIGSRATPMWPCRIDHPHDLAGSATMAFAGGVGGERSSRGRSPGGAAGYPAAGAPRRQKVNGSSRGSRRSTRSRPPRRETLRRRDARRLGANASYESSSSRHRPLPRPPRRAAGIDVYGHHGCRAMRTATGSTISASRCRRPPNLLFLGRADGPTRTRAQGRARTSPMGPRSRLHRRRQRRGRGPFPSPTRESSSSE
jgi:hypothetical protein